jgi:hypothetical protein
MRPDDGGMQALKALTEHSRGDKVAPVVVVMDETDQVSPASVDRNQRVPYVR